MNFQYSDEKFVNFVRRRPEEKMAAALASREAAERERLLALQAAQQDRLQKQAHAQLSKLERQREAERVRRSPARRPLRLLFGPLLHVHSLTRKNRSWRAKWQKPRNAARRRKPPGT